MRHGAIVAGADADADARGGDMSRGGRRDPETGGEHVTAPRVLAQLLAAQGASVRDENEDDNSGEGGVKSPALVADVHAR
jgi:hypothetical protein